jgi:hypothetical protein
MVDKDGSNCTCKHSKFGCCPDGISNAPELGSDCGDCKGGKFGCCPDGKGFA